MRWATAGKEKWRCVVTLEVCVFYIMLDNITLTVTGSSYVVTFFRAWNGKMATVNNFLSVSVWWP